MKNLLVMFILFFAVMLGAYSVWQEDGIPVRLESNLYWIKATLPLSDGSSLIVWNDGVNEVQQIKAFKLDANGNHLWSENGVVLADNQKVPLDYKLIESEDGSIILVWEETKSNSHYLLCQKINSDGERLWQESGIPIFTYLNSDIGCTACTDGNGGCFITWGDYQDGDPIITMQHITTTGEIANGFDDDGIIVYSGPSNSLQIIYSGANTAYCVWSSNWTTKVQEVSFSGTLHWDEEGLSAGFTTDRNSHHQLACDSDRNLYITAMSGYSEDYSLVCQKISSLGEILWDETLIIDQNIFSSNYSAYMNSEGDLITYCIADSCTIRLQKSNSDGDLLWDNPEIYIEDNVFYTSPEVRTDTLGNTWVTWQNCTGTFQEIADVRLQKFNTDGELLFDDEGITIIEESLFRKYPVVFPDDNDNALVLWKDYRDNNDGFFVQKVDSAGNTMFEENGVGIYSCLAGKTRYPKTCASSQYTAIFWTDNRMDDIYQIYMQVIDNTTGEFMLAENGVQAIETPDDLYDDYECAILEDDQQIAVAWKEFTDGEELVKFQIFDINGNKLLGEDGELINTDTSGYIGEIKLAEYDNGFNIYWEMGFDWMSFDRAIYAQRYENLQPQWDEGISVINNFGEEVPLYLSDVNENYVIWEYNYTELYAQKITGSGELAWQTEGVLAGEVINNWINVRESIIANDGILLFWYYRDQNDDYMIFCQHISSDGVPAYVETGQYLLTIFSSYPEVIFAAADEAIYVGCSDYNYLYINKYDYEGNLLWNVEPITNGTSLSISKIDIDNELLSIYFCNNDIYGIYLDTEGNIYENTPANGFSVCSAANTQSLSSMHNIGNNDHILVWYDDRTESWDPSWDSIYMQKLDLSPVVSISEDEIISSIELYNYPNPFNPTTTINFTLPEEIENAELNIYNIKGQRVKSFKIQNSKLKINTVEWNAEGEPSGVYFYRLDIDNSPVRKMLLLK